MGKRNCHQNALVCNYFSSDLRSYADGYYLGANLLVDEINKDQPSNILVYPICFLYRHFIEISPKGIIEKCERLGHNIEKTKKRKNHVLKTLLGNAGKLTKEHFGKSFSEEIEQTIQEMDKVDPKSQTFRYTTSQKGDQFFPDHDVIGLGTLKNKMVKVHDELLGTLIGLDEKLNTETEIRQEYDYH